MGEFILNGRNYGGSIITPNPSDTPTDSLDSIKINDTIYEIQGGGSNLILDAQRYSLDEQVIGIWMDGKPLYQKTINCGALPNNTDKRVQHGIQNIDCFVGVFGIAENPNINSIPIIFSNSGGSGIATVILEKSSDIIIRCNSDRSTYTKTFVTLQYTKTTDTAGSGGYQAYGFSPIIYSETEREVGVWIDNKPLYQCTEHIILSTPIEPETETSVTLSSFSNAEKVFNISVLGGYKGSDSVVSKWVTFMEQSYIHTAADKVITNWNKNLMKVQSGSNYNNFPSAGVDNRFIEFYITIQYTKTTDVAGSSDYNTLAIPNVHYSTDEQVIGTWIDGKTLYQKTKVISFSELTHQGNLYYTQFRETGENVVDVKAKAVSTSYGMCYLGCKNYTMNNEESYWELIMYYNNICLKFTGTTATDTNVSTITVTYQYTKTT